MLEVVNEDLPVADLAGAGGAFDGFDDAFDQVVGHQEVKNISVADYTDYSITLGKDFGNGFSASAAFVGSNAKRAFYTDFGGRFIGNNTVVLGVKYTYSF